MECVLRILRYKHMMKNDSCDTSILKINGDDFEHAKKQDDNIQYIWWEDLFCSSQRIQNFINIPMHVLTNIMGL